MIFLILVFTINGYIHQFLHETPSLDNQCADDNSIGLNYFIGEKYFYNYITQNGAYVDFSKVTFILWIKFIDNNPYKSTGRQILFQLVDGSDDNPYVNLQLSVFPLNGQLQVALYNGYAKINYKPQYMLNLTNIANANKLLGWNQILISIDQSMTTSYLNMKLYDSNKNAYYQLQTPVINGTIFEFIISQQTRITNEALIGQRSIDTRACAFIANFEYYIGWVTMDTEKLLDYSSKLEFYIQTNGVQLDSLVNSINLKTQSGIYLSQESLQIYKNTRLEYIFKQQMDSFLLSFWINPNIVTQGSINPNYQLFSLTDDSLLNTAIGFGVNNQLKLLLYQNFDVELLTQLSSGWTHIIAYFIQNSWNDNFIPQQHKLMNIYVNGIYRMQLGIDNIIQWSRIVIGFSFRDIQDANYVQIKELQIYSGMGLQTSKFGCLFSSNGICILCDPNNPQFTYIANLCPTQIQPTYQICQTGTAVCNITITSDVQKYNSILCLNNYIYSSLQCIGGLSYPCGLSMNKGCYNCLTGTLKLLNTGELRCPAECTSIKNGLYVFNVEGICKQVCQYYTMYYYNCQQNIPVVTCVDQCPDGYVGVSNGICVHPDFFAIIPTKLRKFDPIKGLIITYTFVPSANLQNYATLKNALLLFPTKVFDQTKTLVQAFKGCQKLFGFPIIYNATQLCIYPCGLCYYSTKSTCLTCQDPHQFLDRQFSTCVVSCDKTLGVLKLNNRLTMTCEQSCPGLIQQNIECVQSCSINYYLFNGQCVKSITVGYYISIFVQPCPQVCMTCTNSNCLTCVGNYPMNNNFCVAKCPQFLDYSTNTCVGQCQPTDLIYQSSDLNGFAFNVCFKLVCGTVQANKKIQTVQHQTNQYKCSQPCDDRYYADYGVLKCQQCQIPCLLCDEKSDFCLTCTEDAYFYENSCFYQCPDLFEDNISKQCVGGCDNGYQLDFNNIKACVQQCDNNKYGIIGYYYKFYCLEMPYYNLYCVGQYCYDCNVSCYTCFGPNNNQCLSCNNLFFYNNICYDACPLGLYSIATTWDCQLTCPAGTFSMDGQQQCFNPCPNGTYLYNNQCYLQQQALTYCNAMEQRYLCFDCYQTCQSCTNKFSTSCTTCKIGFFFNSGTCKLTCAKGTYLFEIECFAICPNDLKMQVDQCVDSCYLGYTEYNNYCKLTCPDGTYKFDLICQPCYEGCATCTDQGNNQCQSCNIGYYLQSGTTCDTTCPSNAPCKNQMNNQCGDACPNIGYVNVLIDAAYCVITCPSYYYGRLCLNPCPSQTWLNGNECRLCDKSCVVCQGDLISECSQCQATHYLDQTTCVEKCPDLRPYANQEDNKCVTICPSYTYFKLMFCFQSCPSYLFTYALNPNLIECVQECYPSSFISGQSCQLCAPECIQCYDFDSSSCIHCQIGFYLSGTTCQSFCPIYYDQVNLSCVPDCEPTLFQHNNQCLLNCPVGYLINEMKCLLQCPSATYLQGSQCLPCDYRCSECMDGTSLQCSQCITNYFMDGSICTLSCPNFYDYINYQCVNICPDTSYQIDNSCQSSCPVNYLVIQDQLKCVQQCQTGYYQDQVTCRNCDYTCSECSALDKCSACAENFALNVDQCVQICWTNNLLFYDKINRLCQSICPNYHYSAYGKYLCVDQCDYYYSGQFCVEACPLGEYGDDLKICKTCPLNCVECNSFTDCTSCKDSLVLTNGLCQISCINQYLNVQTKICVNQCSINQYILDDRCLNSCPSQYFEYNFKCLQQCPVSTYRDEQHCLDCSIECLSCVGPTSANCLICAQGYYQNNQICTMTCPINYYYDQYNFVCSLKCDKNLFEQNDQCLHVCPLLSYYEKCVTLCPNHTYQFNLVCQECKPICLSCNQFECLSCIDGYYLNNGICGLLCSKYYDQFKKQCVDQCETQQFIFMNQCLVVCPNLPTYSYKQQCLINCPEQTIIDGTKCSECPERCQACSVPTTCEQCQQGYYLNGGICLVACPESNPFQYNGLCVIECPSNTFYLLNKCLDKCPIKYQAQRCIDKCPDGYFGDICTPCQSQCKTCTSYQICTSCNPNYFFQLSSCDTICPEIYDTIKWECTDDCDGLKLGQYCYLSCPIDSFQQGEICQNSCDDGYYNLDHICTQCATQCQLCTTSQLCQQCSISYFLHEQSCLLICPLGLFSDPKSKKCNPNCPNNMFIYQRSCLFSCPKGYFQNKKECAQSCSSNQLLVGEICKDCPKECQGCTGLKNSDCITCSSTAILKDDICQSSQCIDGYYLLDGQCYYCQIYQHFIKTEYNNIQIQNQPKLKAIRLSNLQSSNCQWIHL